MSDHTHPIQLRFHVSGGKAQFEPVHAERLDGGAYLILSSPGFVYGLAAGDEIEVDQAAGTFHILARGGNISIRVFSELPLAESFDLLADEVQSHLHGRIDGRLERAAVFTVAASGGFDDIEELFNAFATQHKGMIWEYGNIYDDKGEALEWWL